MFINWDKTQKEQEQDYRDTPGEKGVGERGRQREGLHIALRKKKTGKWRKGLGNIQGRNYHQTSPTTRNRDWGLGHSAPNKEPRTRQQQEQAFQREGGRSNLIPLLTLYIVYTQILTNQTPLKLRKLTLKHTLTLFLLTSPPNHLTVQLPQTLGEIPLGRRGWVREGDRGKGNTTVKDTLTCALINARSLCNKKEEMVSYVY